MFITMLSTAAFNWLQVGIGDDATNDALKRSRIMRGIDALMASMIDQETGIRGYLVSGNEDFLAPYRSGQTRLEEQQRALRAEWTNSADQVARLDAFVGLASKWRNDVAEAEIKLMQQKTTQADARALESSGAGKASMDAMRAKAGEMTDVAQARLATALAAQDAAVATSYATLLMA
ncbi:CHASE3 domain-containing protein [Rhizobium sp. Leaf341]|uniref:CHASE3 domain-containing protein n=1 Tax=Rhizobium sp. Leaf341 TaxID=1736344 RepID=UPI0007159CE5|nr:hypothetical protein ASG03_03785 [Rhizobium sp. Leaf341]